MTKTKPVFRCWSCDDLPIISGEKEAHCRYLKHIIMTEPNSLNNNNEPEETKSLVLKLLEFAESLIVEIFIASNDASKVYALVPVNSHFESIELSSAKAVNWLKISYYDLKKEIHNELVYENALDVIKQKSLFDENTSRKIIHKRIASTDSSIYYDLCTQNWDLVKITTDSVSIVPHDQTTPMFERSKNQTPQQIPRFDFNGNPLEKFCTLLRITDDVFKVHLISFFIENSPSPVLGMMGMQGSIKSTICAFIKRLVDPAGDLVEDNLSHMSKKSDDLIIHFANNLLVSFDNVSHITSETSDNLCRAVTGASYPKRKLYQDQDEVILKFKRKIVINGITLNIDRGDLAERTILYFTEGIPSGERKSSSEVEKEFAELLPYLLGHIFTILQNAMSNYPQVKKEIKTLPRMADFVLWGESISLALGNPRGKFLNLYQSAMERGSEILNEGNILIPFLESQLDEKTESIAPMSYFFGKLENFAKENHFDTKAGDFPKGPQRVRGFIERNKPLLQAHGYDIEIFKNTEQNGFTKNVTLVKLKRIPPPRPPCPPLSKMDNFSNTSSECGEGGGPVMSGDMVRKESDDL